MPEYAWLDLAFGVWNLVTENDDDPVRYWGDKKTALLDLAKEGWLLIGPFPR
jgi:hypothetical protein